MLSDVPSWWESHCVGVVLLAQEEASHLHLGSAVMGDIAVTARFAGSALKLGAGFAGSSAWGPAGAVGAVGSVCSASARGGGGCIGDGCTQLQQRVQVSLEQVPIPDRL